MVQLDRRAALLEFERHEVVEVHDNNGVRILRQFGETPPNRRQKR